MKGSIFLFLVMIFTACISEDESPLPANNEVVFFQFEYINHAWGYQHHGFIVDGDGNIYAYEKPANWIFAEDEKISVEDFQNNLAQAQVQLSQMDEAELKRMQMLAWQAKTGTLSKRQNQMYDAGVDSYAIYVAQTGSDSLTRCLLQVRGDYYQRNETSASDEIVDWLIGIRGEEVFDDQPFHNQQE